MLSPSQDAARQDLQAWRTELLRALGGRVDGIAVVLVEGVVRARALLAAHGQFDGPPGPAIERASAEAVVRMARWLRMLGLSRHEVSMLDLGRWRRAH